ncbi:unnamed protein product, partial [Symbiodinium microadriaticum]
VSEGREQVPPVLFIGNKKDLTDKDPDSKQVTPDDVERLLQACSVASTRVNLSDSGSTGRSNTTWSMLHFETSALSGERVEEIFEIMVREIRRRRQPAQKKKKSWCFLL